jgi:hypothetical protein
MTTTFGVGSLTGFGASALLDCTTDPPPDETMMD